MLQQTLNRRIERALHALNLADTLTQVLKLFEIVNIKIDEYLFAIARGGSSQINESASAIHNVVASLPNETRCVNSRTLFREIETLEEQLSEALTEDVEEHQYIAVVLERLDKFAEAYNVYVNDQAAANAFPLLMIARRLRQTLAEFRGMLEYFSVNSSGGTTANTDEAELSLAVQNASSPQDFAAKIAAINALYFELCTVLNVSVASHPLRIGKIESGSLWTLLFGDIRVIGLMITLISESVRFLHRNYTGEGQLAAIPRKLESLNLALDFSNRLKESGVDVSAAEASLAESAVIIATSLNTIVGGQTVVEVNGQVLSLGAELDRASLENSATRKLLSSPAINLASEPDTDENPDAHQEESGKPSDQ